MKKVAVFDIDGTVFRSSLLIELVEKLIESGIFPKEARSYTNEQLMWLDRKGEYSSYIDAVVKSFEKHLKGVHYSDFSDVAKRVLSEHRHRVYKYTRDLIKELKTDGYYLLAISQSPKTILEGFCKNLGFDKVYGRIYEIGPQDRFTGEIAQLHLISNKANIIKRVVGKEDLTLKDSIGVGDSEGDIPFLEIVDNPICFNPNSILFKEAKRLGWDIVLERKDVIYKL